MVCWAVGSEATCPAAFKMKFPFGLPPVDRHPPEPSILPNVVQPPPVALLGTEIFKVAVLDQVDRVCSNRLTRDDHAGSEDERHPPCHISHWARPSQSWPTQSIQRPARQDACRPARATIVGQRMSFDIENLGCELQRSPALASRLGEPEAEMNPTSSRPSVVFCSVLPRPGHGLAAAMSELFTGAGCH